MIEESTASSLRPATWRRRLPRFALGLALALTPLISMGCQTRDRPRWEGGNRPNLVLISVDTLRADHLEIYGYHRSTAPEVARLSEEGVVFEQAFSQAPKTAPSHMTMLTGLYPESHGVKNLKEGEENRALGPEVATLAEVLRSSGYRTGAFVGGAHVSSTLGFDRGFEVFVEGGWIRSQLERAVKFAESQNATRQPFFLFVHTYVVHDPYVPPLNYQVFNAADYDGDIIGSLKELTERAGDEWSRQHELFWEAVDPESPADLERLIDLYDAGILFADAHIGGFFKWLQRAGILENTLVVFVSDHGEEFLDHGGFLHETLYQEILHVPLILRWPDSVSDEWKGLRIRDVVRLVDLMPTLLDFLEIESPEVQQGGSLLPLIEGRRESPREVVSQWPRAGSAALRMTDWKVIRHLGDRRLELYDLEQDPLESTDLADRHPDRAATLQRRLDAVLERSATLHSGMMDGADVEISQEQRDQLRALGYLGGSDAEREDPPQPDPRP